MVKSLKKYMTAWKKRTKFNWSPVLWINIPDVTDKQKNLGLLGVFGIDVFASLNRQNEIAQ